MLFQSIVLFGLGTLSLGWDGPRPSLHSVCDKGGEQFCAIDRTHILQCDHGSNTWEISSSGGCLPGCCIKGKGDHVNHEASCLAGIQGNCLYREDSDDDDDDDRPHGYKHLAVRGEPDLHSADSRCNPLNLTEVQRFVNGHWKLHFTCDFKDSCKDVNGIGTCAVGNGLYIIPAANDTTEYHRNGTAKLPKLRTEGQCDPEDPHKSMRWNGTGWYVDGVCHPPFVCHDFAGQAGFTFCSHPEAQDKSIWLPWPQSDVLPKIISGGHMIVSKCIKKSELAVLDGTNWDSFQNCTYGFECRDLPDGHGLAGCHAPSLGSTLYQQVRNVLHFGHEDHFTHPTEFAEMLEPRSDDEHASIVDDCRDVQDDKLDSIKLCRFPDQEE